MKHTSMPLKLMYITNNPEIAQIAQNAGVDRIWIDLETLGKEDRQGHLDSVKSHHSISDIAALRPIIDKSELMVRINPINVNSRNEINAVVNSGADLIMLPMFKNRSEVQTFLDLVNGRTKTMLLLETMEAEKCVDDIISIKGIDEIHIGLNDLHLAHKMKFMFELLADGTVERLCQIFRNRGIPYGFGGIAYLGTGILPAENILTEHYRLGSSMVILSRGFCPLDDFVCSEDFEYTFSKRVKALRSYEDKLLIKTEGFFKDNQVLVRQKIMQVINKI